MVSPLALVCLAGWLSSATTPVAVPTADPLPLHATLPSSWHEDSQFGYKIRPPKDWAAIPVKVDEGWLIGKFLSSRSYPWHDKQGGWSWDHNPEMMVIAFVHEVVNKRGPTESEEDDVVVVEWKNRYKDYKDYLRQTYSGGGYYVSEEEEGKVGGVPVTQIQIKVEKLTNNGPKRIVTWIYHIDGVDIAVQIEVLEGVYKKLERDIKRTLKSFKPIERTGPLPSEQSSSSDFTIRIKVSDLDEMTLAERTEQKILNEVSTHERALSNLPDDWKDSYINDILVLDGSGSKKLGKTLAAQGGAVFDWLEDTFPFVGPEEYVRRPILRICKTSDQESSYHRGGKAGGWGWSGSGSLEVVTNAENRSLYEIGSLNRSWMQHWFQERDRELYWAFPEWLDYGLDGLLENSVTKGKKLAFYPDRWDRDDFRVRVSKGTASRPRDFLRMTWDEFYGMGGDGAMSWSRTRDAGIFVYWLFNGKSAKKSDREWLIAYMQNFRDVMTEMEVERKAVEESEAEVKAREDEEGDKPEAASPEEGQVPEEDVEAEDEPSDEDEEAEAFSEKQEWWKASDQRKRLIEATFRRTFSDWDEKDWDRLEARYFKEMG